MLSLSLIGSLATVSLPVASIQAEENPREEIQLKRSPNYQAIMMIHDAKDPNLYGTGFFIGNNTLLTNKHVIMDALDDVDKMAVTVKTASGESVEYNIEEVIPAPKEEQDLALIRLKKPTEGPDVLANIDPLKLADNSQIQVISKGDAVYTVGYPGDQALGSLWKSSGEISEVDGAFLSFNAYISGGSSGSPIFNTSDEIIGLANASTEDEEDPQSFGFPLSEELMDFINQHLK